MSATASNAPATAGPNKNAAKVAGILENPTLAMPPILIVKYPSIMLKDISIAQVVSVLIFLSSLYELIKTLSFCSIKIYLLRRLSDYKEGIQSMVCISFAVGCEPDNTSLDFVHRQLPVRMTLNAPGSTLLTYLFFILSLHYHSAKKSIR